MDILSTIHEIVGSVPTIRAVLGFILVFLLPGFAWTLVFFSGRQISIIERLVLSIGLSIAVVTLSIFVLNKLIGIRITGLNSILIIIVVTLIPTIYYFLKRLTMKQGSNTTT